MTVPMSYDEMQAGSELDALVAERVMGWTQWVDLSNDCPNEPGVTYFANWGSDCGVAVYVAGDLSGDPAFYFAPSRDIADAWLICERLNRFEGVYDPADQLRWSRFHDALFQITLWGKTASEAALSICCAALQSVAVYEIKQP